MNELIRAVNQADTPNQMVTAVKNLAAAKDPAAIPTFIAVFGYNNPAAAAVAVAALTEFGDLAVPELLNQIDDYNYGARAYSIRTLAAIADPRALDVLISTAATDFAPSVRRAAAKGLGHLNWHKLDVSQRQLAINRALEALLFISQDADWSIRYAAVVGLQALAKVPEVQQTIVAKFSDMLHSDREKAVRARVRLAYTQ
ncbi:PBS lyase HEAT-like repeat protein [Richelia sinica FACHB-800]|uniref:PBS lyase HEAT-like repeat protein n=1 Tax=Richelia sinica FACHB-800 TaxID=1357546 RepID=A0A975Y4Q6_9NOST|nr:HEAT repeat domain-containing protein [Richelia sinica]MBD2666823.1 HEAT repeat domain-containing protein [Richelia sinica FACHB-800]QXE23429.1 PBS lyase HEAT-like repeat protein [Richelia sinica FACHB-800]